MNYKILLTCILSTILSFSYAQESGHSCGYDHWFRNIRMNDAQKARAINDQFSAWIEQSRQQHRDDEVYQIPVVFHIVYNTGEQNLADSVVHSQLAVLNEDYRRLNANSIDTRDEFLPVAADVGIEFVLAQYDPEGNPTTGIVRTETERESFELNLFSTENTLDEVKFSSTDGSDAWDTEHYLNIWVCNIDAGFLGQVFGLAYPPATVPNWPDGTAAPSSGTEGVIIHYTTLGRNNPQHAADGVAENNHGRTLVHEVGHYLGLRHIWGDAIAFLGEDGCAVDDGFIDTPNCAESANFVCDFSSNSCTDGPEDLPNMIENYMDYSQDACMNMFTQEQADMMRFALTELRPGLLNSPALSVDSREEQKVELYPNPAVDMVSIKSNSMIDRIEILDHAGRVLKVQSVNDRVETQVSLKGMAAGSYLIRIHSGKNVAVRKLIKQ